MSPMYVKGRNAKREFVNACLLPAQSNADVPSTVEITAHGLRPAVRLVDESHIPKKFETPINIRANPNTAMQCARAVCDFLLNNRLSTRAIPTPAMNSHPRVNGE